MFMQVSYHTSLVLMLLSVVLTFIAVFSPVAGLLSDIRFSRHRAVVCSSWFIIVKILCVLVVLTGWLFLLPRARMREQGVM